MNAFLLLILFVAVKAGSESGAVSAGGGSFDSVCTDSTTWHQKGKKDRKCALLKLRERVPATRASTPSATSTPLPQQRRKTRFGVGSPLEGCYNTPNRLRNIAGDQVTKAIKPSERRAPLRLTGRRGGLQADLRSMFF
ncbi:hypothetical protein JL720_1666 [Aureococcus anophagefferens]|nr:hypothetical protein JL720_1666 [Aureococcus anophagefferens]